MIDYDILDECGTTPERLREIFTAEAPDPKVTYKPGEKKRIKKDVERRRKLEDLICSRLMDGITFSLRNSKHYQAVDLAWDSTPINPFNVPLMMYAQGRIDLGRCTQALSSVSGSEQYIKKDGSGKVVGINMPKFTETNVNLVRSVITRRLAAQANKFSNLWPHYDYDTRATDLVSRLRGEATSQRIDIMADQYGYKAFEVQMMRDMMLYTNSVAFPRCAWERDVQWRKKPGLVTKEKGADGKEKIAKEWYIEREGVSWVRPHPSRLFYDKAWPLSSLNTDTGCEWVGYWDVCRYADVLNNPHYFNRDAVSYSDTSFNIFSSSNFAEYWNLYGLNIIAPPEIAVTTSPNDRKNNVGIYNSATKDSSVFLAEYYCKLIPNEWGIGEYPYPVWFHFKVAGERTVVFAEIMPSRPAAAWSFNANDARLLNPSIAHELMGFQDQASNLLSQILETAKADLFSVALINSDVFNVNDEGKKILAEFKSVMAGENFYTSMQALEVSFEKFQQMGIEVDMDNILKIVRSSPNGQITTLFEALAKVVSMAERLLALSPQEMGQPSPRETSATEVTLIASTTESVYGFISDAIDEGRAAMKRICYESTIACADANIELPVVSRFPDKVITDAGFTIKPGSKTPEGMTIVGTKDQLVHDYIFTSRDGAERAVNSQSSAVLVQMVQFLLATPVAGIITKSQFFDIVNEILRLAGAGHDLKFELKPGEEDGPLETMPDPKILQQILAALKGQEQDIMQLQQLAAQLTNQPMPSNANPLPAAA